MTPCDVLERGVEDIAGCVLSLANVAALLVAEVEARQEAASIDIRRSHVPVEISVQLSSTIAKQCAYLRTWLVEMMKTPQPTVFVFGKVDTTTPRPLGRLLVIFTHENHPHCKQLSGQDNLGNFVARKRLPMSICTTPTNNSKKNTLSFEQPPNMPRATLYFLPSPFPLALFFCHESHGASGHSPQNILSAAVMQSLRLRCIESRSHCLEPHSSK